MSGVLTKMNENLSTDFTDLHRFFFFSAFSASLWFVILVGV
jgi:hypothetical protein